ncbi:uncharacterized protein LY79DRAFT_708614 [Colletotrichum navitas]|uniref:Uncharacterized protein n=1 Tax=Colletotrichum navitas TaxID=681940 RepID=A0AAD8UVH7_9PEZI|nr:uncharacterized protein LY79DRAFT_708614 [Colletotrichum navitas]KAK1561242.1 hypothetical protein LY79DRAFT_708614 [Colletotrichum navitas]
MRLSIVSTLALLFMIAAADKCICNDKSQLSTACKKVRGKVEDGFCITKKSDKFLNQCPGICRVMKTRCRPTLFCF